MASDTASATFGWVRQRPVRASIAFGSMAFGLVAAVLAAPMAIASTLDGTTALANPASAGQVEAARADAELKTTTRTLRDSRTLAVHTQIAAVVDLAQNDQIDPQDVISYRFLVTNTGTAPIRDVTVRDPLVADDGSLVVCSPTVAPPGTDVTCTTDRLHIVSAADAKRGAVVSRATATAQSPTGRVTGRTVSMTPVAGPGPQSAAGLSPSWLIGGLGSAAVLAWARRSNVAELSRARCTAG